AIVITAGFAEMGEDGVEQQRELAKIARVHDMLLLGPNTIGTHDYRRGLPLSFVWFDRRPPSDAGSVAVVTQRSEERRVGNVTGVQTCALPISRSSSPPGSPRWARTASNSRENSRRSLACTTCSCSGRTPSARTTTAGVCR